MKSIEYHCQRKYHHHRNTCVKKLRHRIHAEINKKIVRCKL